MSSRVSAEKSLYHLQPVMLVKCFVPSLQLSDLSADCFLKVLSNVRFLARQGLALRGDGDEADSNFMSLLNLRSENNSKLVEWVKQKTCKYTSAAMQNKMVRVTGLFCVGFLIIFKMLLFTQ